MFKVSKTFSSLLYCLLCSLVSIAVNVKLNSPSTSVACVNTLQEMMIILTIVTNVGFAGKALLQSKNQNPSIECF